MSELLNINVADVVDGVCIGELQYGTIVTDVTGQRTSIYMKVDKHKTGMDVSVNYPRNNCVLVNLKLGTLRAVKGDTPVKVLQGKMNLSPASPQMVLRAKKQ